MSEESTSHFKSLLDARLDSRREAGSLRVLKSYEGIDFCSNDYLGLSELPLHAETKAHGSTGSRLISGQSEFNSQVEEAIAKFHGFEAGLIFSSGYSANLGLLSALADRQSIVISDELIHASLIDGIRLSNAKRVRFAHNDLDDLKDKLEKHSSGEKPVFVVTEAVFSMDGDIAPLSEIVKLCTQYNAALIVDEAHSIGVYGEGGAGLVAELGLQDQVAAVVYTFGKAPGYHGAIICGSKTLQSYLINFCRSFIYTTAPSPQMVSEIASAYERMKKADEARDELQAKISYFRAKASMADELEFLQSETAIQAVIISGNDRCKAVASNLQKGGFAIKEILSPTVAQGSERLRICLHAQNEFSEIDALFTALKDELL